jgi:transposase InsO family protein
MYHELRRLGLRATRQEVRRAYVELGLLRKRSRRAVRTTDSRHASRRYPNLLEAMVVERPNQVWVADVTYVRIRSEFAYLALLMDVFTRRVVGWAMSWANDTRLTLRALRAGLDLGLAPEYHHSDQGSNYASRDYVRLLQARAVSVSMAQVGEPTQNAYAERLNRTVKEEHVYFEKYLSLKEAVESIGPYVEWYNTRRIHTSLSNQTPSEIFTRAMLDSPFSSGEPLS